MKVEENEIREFFARFGSVKEVKIITYRGGICKGYGFVYFSEDVDIQTIIEQQVTFKGRKLKLGPAIMKERSSRETGSIQSPIIGSSQWVSPSPYVYCTCCPPSLVTPNVLSGSAQYVQPYSYPGFQGVMIPQVPMNYAPTAYPYPMQHKAACAITGSTDLQASSCVHRELRNDAILNHVRYHTGDFIVDSKL
ncbi:deleted in azoospermia-like isoform X2 [Silurus meridionalis]|nr:deleted in azoospermia-like isoform X2 [Silurus meridionalis]